VSSPPGQSLRGPSRTRAPKTNHHRRRHNWADDVDGEEITDDLPPPQKITNKDGSTTIIEYHYNDKDQKVKTTRRIRFITHREVVNPRVADRKSWAKFGQSAKDGAGPAADTTTVGENIIFKPSTNWRKDAKDESKDANAQAMKDKLKDKKVKCRICNGEHFTARCPYKDTMAPIGEAAAGGSQADAEDLGARDTGAGAAGAGKKGSYVPPALRSGAGASAGDRMGGSKYGERDDLATLRVTNVSSALDLRCGGLEGEIADFDGNRFRRWQKRTSFVTCSSVSVVLLASFWQRIGIRVWRRDLPSSVSRIGLTQLRPARRWTAMVSST
jgi:translation initiation factor 3 subunit G